MTTKIFSADKMYLLDTQHWRTEGQPITLVLLQVGLDVETSAVCIAVLLFRQTNIYLAFCC